MLVIAPFLPALWALIAAVIWWRHVFSPALFAVAAVLGLFGIQAVVAFLWDYWPVFRGGYFLEVRPARPEEVEKLFEASQRRAMIQAAIVLVAAVPFLWWLKSGLSKLP